MISFSDIWSSIVIKISIFTLIWSSNVGNWKMKTRTNSIKPKTALDSGGVLVNQVPRLRVAVKNKIALIDHLVLVVLKMISNVFDSWNFSAPLRLSTPDLLDNLVIPTHLCELLRHLATYIVTLHSCGSGDSVNEYF